MVDVWGWVAMLVLMPATVFQIVRNFHLKSAQGVSSWTFISLLLGFGIFFPVSIYQNAHPAIIFNYLFGFAGAATVLFQKYHYRADGKSKARQENVPMRAIGRVDNNIVQKYEGLIWRRVESKIVLREELSDALEGIDEYSHAYVLFHFDKLKEEDRELGKLAPYGFEDVPEKGILATRMPQRPNYIALTLVRVVKREGNVLTVRGLDALNGTPVLDIKPYTGLPKDAPGGCTIPLWAKRVNR